MDPNRTDSLSFPSQTPQNLGYPPANQPAVDPAVAAARDKLASVDQRGLMSSPLAVALGAAGNIPKPVSPAAQYQATNRPRYQTRSSRWRPVIAAVAMFVFLVMFFKSGVLLSQLRYLTADTQPTTSAPAATNQAVVAGPEPLIIIPKINVNAPVVFEPSIEEAKIQKALQNGVVHYGTSPLPGQGGNSVIVGHSSNDWWEPGNYKFVFVLLDKLAAGDTITVQHNSRRYIYTVTEVKVVEPTDVSVLAPTAEPILTLITCTPPGTSWKRLIIRARQTSPEPSQAVLPAAKPVNPAETTLPSSAPSTMDQLKKLWQSVIDLFIADEGEEPAPAPRNQPVPQTLPRAL
jgi:LPXTG-site transpeptidase (sortase) family protein